MSTLSFQNHSRTVLNRRYIYPVISRRSKGVSLGINLSVNNRCNWRCAYCQVPNLQRGGSPKADLEVLRKELFEVLNYVIHGDFMDQYVPKELRRLNDIALSGNGEPFACPNIKEVFEVIQNVKTEIGVNTPIIVITNGSYLSHPKRLSAVQRLGTLNGSLWAKIDAGSEADMRLVNGISTDFFTHLRGIAAASKHVKMIIQTCLLHFSHSSFEKRLADYLVAIDKLLAFEAKISSVQLYTLARPAQQGIAVSAVSNSALDQAAAQLRSKGLDVSCAYAPK